ncbi:MAG: BamA/TamA family outer membrane protein [Deltaproteobacteria bacterium]|nr:BamA/TamA family outer membrane protein [Deltaproteobacteria bacterium]
MRTRVLLGLRCLAALLLAPALLACGAQRPQKVPGESDITVSEVSIQPAAGTELRLDYSTLFQRLGMRASSLLLPGRYYSEFRENEDRRRLVAFWHTFGFFDVEVGPPEVVHDTSEASVAITWTVTENQRYRVNSVHLLHEPEGHRDQLLEMISFSAGETEVDLEKYRYVRRAMADHLRRSGFGHARVYSRAFVDRDKQDIHWYYYVDAGPKTRVRYVVVDGNVKVPAELIIERSGLRYGEPYDWNKRFDGEFHLLDTGAFASTFIRADVDTKFHVPGDAPDTGGVLKEEQVDGKGNLVPRDLPEEIDVKIHVVEAPSQQLRVRAGAEFDPTRIDTALSSRLWLRNLFGPWHHLVLEGRIGYGWLWRSTTEDPTGLYGEALARYVKPMFLTRLLDSRVTVRFRDELYPGYHLRELTAGPGLRYAIWPGRAKSFHGGGLFFDTDLYFRWGQQVGFGPFATEDRAALSLADDDVAMGPELQASLIWDERDNPLEALQGHLLAFRATFSPPEPLATHRYLTLAPEARGFLPLGDSFAFGLRAAGSWVTLEGDGGVPLGPRLFGGGSFGMRGYGRHHLSPTAPVCPTPAGPALMCRDVPVGGLSLAEASLEGRWLPPLKPYGAIFFADAGGAGAEYNPFDSGLSLALGLGLRVRFWYLPLAFDAGYRLLADNQIQAPEDDPFLVFFRLGEAF